MKKFLFNLIMILTCFTITTANNSNYSSRTTVATAESGNWTATYYGDRYKTQRRTANGDVFNMYAMTCAAPKKYPFGTTLKVTNLANNKSVVVKVTDRGAFGNRTIDLTYGAFGKIANHRTGRVKIKVEVVNMPKS